MILIVGASSTVGKAVIPLLLQGGYPLRLTSRYPDKLKAFEGAGVEIVVADLLDKDSIVRACQGVEKVLLSSHSIPRLMHFVLKPFHAGMSSAMQLVVLNDHVPTPYDMSATLEQFPMSMTRLEDWVRAQMQQ